MVHAKFKTCVYATLLWLFSTSPLFGQEIIRLRSQNGLKMEYRKSCGVGKVTGSYGIGSILKGILISNNPCSKPSDTFRFFFKDTFSSTNQYCQGEVSTALTGRPGTYRVSINSYWDIQDSLKNSQCDLKGEKHVVNMLFE